MPEGSADDDSDDSGMPEDVEDDRCPKPQDLLRMPVENLPE